MSYYILKSYIFFGLVCSSEHKPELLDTAKFTYDESTNILDYVTYGVLLRVLCSLNERLEWY